MGCPLFIRSLIEAVQFLSDYNRVIYHRQKSNPKQKFALQNNNSSIMIILSRALCVRYKK